MVGFPENDMPVADECLPKEKKEVEGLITKFKPKTKEGCEMWEVLSSELDIDRVIAVEVDHCP